MRGRLSGGRLCDYTVLVGVVGRQIEIERSIVGRCRGSKDEAISNSDRVEEPLCVVGVLISGDVQ